MLFRVAAEVRDALSAPMRMAKAPPFAAVSAFVRDVEKMAHLCHGSGIAFLAVLQPVLGLSGKEMTAAERQALARIPRIPFDPKGYHAMIRELYSPTQRTFARLELPPRTHAIDGTELFASMRDECFRDEVHFTDLGDRRAAVFIADAIRRHDLLGDPEAARQAPEIVGRGW